MRLGFTGKSVLGVGYVPDWIKVCYREGRKKVEVTFDINGSIDYDTDTLSCNCKCDLVPWAMLVDGEEIDLSEMDIEELDLMFPIERVYEIFYSGTEYEVGIYPVSDEGLEFANKDKLTDCEGYCEFCINDTFKVVNFKFKAEFCG